MNRGNDPKKRRSASEWLKYEQADVRLILRDLIENSQNADRRWAGSSQLISSDPSEALTQLVEFRIALQQVGGAVESLLEVYEELSTLLDEELPAEE